MDCKVSGRFKKHRQCFQSLFMYKLVRLGLLIPILILSLFLAPAQAQTLPSDLSNVKVDDLTDAQIKQMVQQAQAAGLSDVQIVQTAEGRGLPVAEGQKLQARIAAYRQQSGNNQAPLSNADTAQYKRKLNYHRDTDSLAGLNKIMFRHSKIFGADIFRNNKLNFAPNLNIATPKSYIIGPQDQLNVSVYGNSLANWRLEVSPDGNINIPGIGLVNVAGKTIEQATADIKGRLIANHYAIGSGSSLHVSLGNIRSIQVMMVGELIKPGTYTLPSLSTAFNALYAAGGPSDNGSFRNIEIIRNGRLLKTLDIYQFLSKGDQSGNTGLRDQDIIRVPSYIMHVEMKGAVKIPGIFEPKPGETLQDIIGYAGGFTDSAYTALIKVSQISDNQRRITDVPEDDFKNYIPLRGDVYTVEGILNRYENRVVISGAVFRPGEYELQKNMTLLQLINQAAGLKEDAFMGVGTILRLKPDNTTATVTFNLHDIITKAAPDIPLQREDVVSISSIFDLRSNYTVSINGAVRKTGDYDYSDSLTVEGLIVMAGGFSEGASAKRIEVARRVYNSDPNQKTAQIAHVYVINVDSLLTGGEKFVLKPFDIVSVYDLPGYEKQKTIKVEGEVLYPGYYTIEKKDERISDIIRRAGGLTVYADAEGGTLKRENIAILGVNKNNTDTAELEQERIENLKMLKERYKDSTSDADIQRRNNYVGIDLNGILARPGSSIDLMVDDGDVIRIPKQEQVVQVNGNVLYPSAVVFDKGKSFKEYVLNAGGYAPDALKRGAYIVYPNGTVRGTRKVLFFNSHPDVKPGSQIYVPKKPARRPLSPGEVIGITSGVASLAAVVLGIITLTK